MSMGGYSRSGFLAIAVIFHLVYVLSIFDIYFVSPIVSGMKLYRVEEHIEKPPADRLFLFVGDGLRADKALQFHPEPYPKSDDDLRPRSLAPFIRSRILEHGTFGVSHTHVPTESRPGHVALIAGLYEDVSAVTTGWKHNPVNFDSVFNRSRHTWSWGSPDILPMFQDGAVPGRVDAYTYGHEFEDFSTDATQLDYWVFDHVHELFESAKHNETLNQALRQDRVVFFLHLLGLDTTGHSYRPYSREYLHNIKVVDEGIRKVCEQVEAFYGNDQRSAYVFTADHGMSDWGSHGDGHPDNTRTPLVAWGSGVAKPRVVDEEQVPAPGHNEYSSDWHLDHVHRHDVDQADVATLMAYLIGAEYPANAAGKLPLDFVDASNREKAQAFLVNARQIIEMYRVKENRKKDMELRFQPFPLFDDTKENGGKSPESEMARIEELIEGEEYVAAMEASAILIEQGTQGMRYLQTYDWLFLRALVTSGYLGWIVYSLTTVCDLYVLQGVHESQRTVASTSAFAGLLALLFAKFVASGAPQTYYFYAAFPVFFWEKVYANRRSLLLGASQLIGDMKTTTVYLGLALNTALYLGVIILLAVGYIHREVLTFFYVLGALWPITFGWSFLRQNIPLISVWSISCLVMSSFTLLPAMKVEDVSLIVMGGALMVLVGVMGLIFEDHILSDFGLNHLSPIKYGGTRLPTRVLIGVQTGFIILSIIVTRSSALSLQAKEGLPLGNQVVGWIVLVASLAVPLLVPVKTPRHYLQKLLVLFLTFAPTFVILTISYEGLFYVAFSATLASWVRLEHALYLSRAPSASETEKSNRSKTHQLTASKIVTEPASTHINHKHRPLQLADSRVVLFFFVLLQSAFFSTGNIASVSSFSLDSVARLIPIFDPFSQGALLMLKLFIPFALISAILGVLNQRLEMAPSALFMIAIAVCDILTLYFFWVVKDEGSWLEIGSTISHFVIASLLCVFLAGLEGASSLFSSSLLSKV